MYFSFRHSLAQTLSAIGGLPRAHVLQGALVRRLDLDLRMQTVAGLPLGRGIDRGRFNTIDAVDL
ncbi:MAG: hypothetical protein AAF662_03085 [Pseudomonadota bacterium]